MEKKTVIIEVQTESGVKQLDRLSAKFDEVYGDVLPLTASIGELEDQLYQMALEGQKGTKEFNLLAAEAGRLKKTLQQVDLEVDGLSMTTANKLGGALGGVTAGFEVMQGAMGAMGAESEKVQEALLKVQSAMAIAQGVQGIRESIPVFKSMAASIAQTAIGQKLLNVAQIAGAAAMRVLNVVMSANPIGLVVTAVAALSAAFYALTQRVDKAAIAQKELQRQLKLTARLAKESQENLSNSWDSSNAKTQQAIDLMKAKGATDKEIYNAERDFINQKLRQMDVQRMSGTKLTKEQYKEYQQLINDKKILDAEYSNSLKQKSEEQQRQYKENLQAQKDAREEKDAADKEALAEKNQAELDAIKKKYDEEQRLNQERISKEDAQFRLERSLTESKQEQEIQDLVASYDEKFLIAEGNAELEKMLLEQQKTDIAAIEDRYREEKEKKDAEQAERELARKRQLAASSLEATKSGLQGISDIIGAFAGKSKAQQKKAFEAQKKLNIAMATIDTIKGAVSAFTGMTSSIPGPVGLALGVVAAAGVTASGIANVKKISSTQFDSGSSPSGTSTGAGGGAPNLPASQPAQFNVVGNSGTNQLANVEGNTPVKAYVVSGDVTSAQSLERNKIVTATL